MSPHAWSEQQKDRDREVGDTICRGTRIEILRMVQRVEEDRVNLLRDIGGLRALETLLQDRVRELEVALRCLYDKIEAIRSDTSYQAILTLAKVHGQDYTGPSCALEMEVAKAVLGGTADSASLPKVLDDDNQEAAGRSA